MSDPARGIACATDTGLSPFHFDMPDFRLIYTAAEVAHEHGTGTVLRLARAALFVEGHWNAYVPADDRTMEWSDDKLVALALSYPSPALVPHYARRLIDVYERIRVAGQCLRRARKLLTIHRGVHYQPVHPPTLGTANTVFAAENNRRSKVGATEGYEAGPGAVPPVAERGLDTRGPISNETVSRRTTRALSRP